MNISSLVAQLKGVFGFVTSSPGTAAVKNIVVLTQAQYDAIAVKDPNTEYNIVAA